MDPKKLLNRGVGWLALLFCGPLLLAIALLIKVGAGGPVFAVETRRTADGDTYGSVRFRTSAAGDASRFGRLLRTSRLELLPQLVNVARGEISIVGALD